MSKRIDCFYIDKCIQQKNIKLLKKIMNECPNYTFSSQNLIDCIDSKFIEGVLIMRHEGIKLTGPYPIEYAIKSKNIDIIKLIFEIHPHKYYFLNKIKQSDEANILFHKINVEDTEWKNLFTLNLQQYPILESKVKRSIQTILIDSLYKNQVIPILPKDVIEHCIYTYL